MGSNPTLSEFFWGASRAMTEDQYVESILTKYAVSRGANSPSERFGSAVADQIRNWSGQYLKQLFYSGSYAKETGVLGSSDVDLFISLEANTPFTLKDIYNDLHTFAVQSGWSPRKQNVSIGVTVGGMQGDLVPAKLQSDNTDFHSLYFRRRDTWMQTNIARHVNVVRGSGRTREIRAIKIWRHLHGLDFPSLYLELFAIDALSGHPSSTLARNVIHVLKTIGSSLATTRIEDPSNSANILSDDLTSEEKKHIARTAQQSSTESSWARIIW